MIEYITTCTSFHYGVFCIAYKQLVRKLVGKITMHDGLTVEFKSGLEINAENRIREIIKKLAV